MLILGSVGDEVENGRYKAEVLTPIQLVNLELLIATDEY